VYDFIRGKLIEFEPSRLVLEANGVGYDIAAALSDLQQLPAIGSEIKLWIHLHQKDEGPSLYGFLHKPERELFRLLIKISGIGPKSAIQILAGIQPADLIRALVDEDWKRLTLIPGIGPKTAKRLLIELKEKLTDKELLLLPTPLPAAPVITQAYNALISLGFNSEAVRIALKDASPNDNLEENIRKALTKLTS
jgi:holliday junction DNA helicase RuvA